MEPWCQGGALCAQKNRSVKSGDKGFYQASAPLFGWLLDMYKKFQ